MNFRIKSFDEYEAKYAESVENPEAFWSSIAQQYDWTKPWDKVFSWDFRKPDVKWFEGGELNITTNCLDRHLKNRADKTAIIWEPNDPSDEVLRLSYTELHAEVCKMANVLKAKGARKGDRICFYMPMIPELAIGVLACARIGAIHSVVFAGFSATALADRINDATCKMVLTSDEIKRGAKVMPCKKVVDDALENCPCVEAVFVAKSTGNSVSMTEGRDFDL